MIHDILSSDLTWRLGWTLLHSIWQILLIWGVTGLLLTLLARQSANARYLVACCGMAAFYLPLAVTFVLVPSRPGVKVSATLDLALQAFHPSPTEQPSIEPPQPTYSPSDSEPHAESIAQPAHASDTAPPVNGSASLSNLVEVVSPWLPSVVLSRSAIVSVGSQ